MVGLNRTKLLLLITGIALVATLFLFNKGVRLKIGNVFSNHDIETQRYYRYNGSAESLIILYHDSEFVRKDYLWFVHDFYAGTYHIIRDSIFFNYSLGHVLDNELTIGKLNGSELVLAYVMKYRKENYLDNNGNLFNGVDTSLFHRNDTVLYNYIAQ